MEPTSTSTLPSFTSSNPIVSSAIQAPGSTMVMMTATTEIPTETEIVVDGMTITVTTVIPTTLVLNLYTHHFKHFTNYVKKN